MLPVLFTIGPFNVYSFGFFLALSFLLSTFIVWKFGREDLKEYEYFDAFLYTTIVTVLFARVVYIATHLNEFGFNILRFFVVRETPGLSLLAGLAFGGLFLFIYAKRKKIDFPHVSDLFSLAFSFGLIFAKIAEQLSGSGFGKETTFFLGVKIVGLTGRRNPVELYEGIFFIVLSIILLVTYRKSVRREVKKGMTTLVFLLGIFVSIFGLEFLKERGVYWDGLSIRQIASGIAGLVVLLTLIYQGGFFSFFFKKIKRHDHSHK